LVLSGTVLSRSALCFPVTCSPRFRPRLSSANSAFGSLRRHKNHHASAHQRLVHHQTCRQAVEEAFGQALAKTSTALRLMAPCLEPNKAQPLSLTRRWILSPLLGKHEQLH
jgi:hypothetical protein